MMNTVQIAVRIAASLCLLACLLDSIAILRLSN
jgi:hypothetical protein